MKKLLTLAIVMLFVLTAVPTFAADISDVANPVLVNGEEVKFDQGPVLYESVLMIPFRFVMEKLGATVTWHGEMQTVFCSLNDNVSTMQIGNNKLFLNTDSVELETAPILHSDRTLVPTSVIETVTGLSCVWEDGKLFIR